MQPYTYLSDCRGSGQLAFAAGTHPLKIFLCVRRAHLNDPQCCSTPWQKGNSNISSDTRWQCSSNLYRGTRLPGASDAMHGPGPS